MVVWAQAAFGSNLCCSQISVLAGRAMGMPKDDEFSDVWVQSGEDELSDLWERTMKELDGDMLLKDLVKQNSRQARFSHIRMPTNPRFLFFEAIKAPMEKKAYAA